MDVPSSSSCSPDIGDGADEAPTHFLMELVTLDHLMMTSSSSKRSKLTCLAVSSQFLILGTSTGGVSVYGRYSSSRKRLNAPSGPLHFINTKDGPVSTLCVAPKEGIVAVGSDSGRVHVIEFSTSPSPVKHLLTRDTRRLKKVTSLIWSTDSKKLYSGHENGAVMVHHLDAKYLFRSSCTVLASFDDGPIVQLDVSGHSVLVSTQGASYICGIDDKNITQVGKKPRKGPLGACFISPAQDQLSSSQQNAVILAARPNGRVWEANAAGVVYRTHQLRENTTFPRPPIISSRNDYTCVGPKVDVTTTDASNSITLGVLQHIVVEEVPYILSISGSCLIVFDVEQSKLVLVSDLQEEICCCCICGADLFVLLRGIAIPRKYTLCSRTMVVKRLLAKSLPIQCAQFMLQYKCCSWPPDLVNSTADALANSTKKAEMESLRKELCELLEEKSLSSKAHDGTVGPSCSTEIHENGEIGGTDGTTCLPRPRKLRARSSSHDSAYASGDAFKRRASYPRSVVDVRCAKLPRNDTPHGDKPHENRVLDPRCRIVGSESLRTLLQMQNPNVVDAVQFVPTVTFGNAAKSLAELALATPASFSCLVPSDEQSAIQPKSNVVVKRRTGPNIVKVVKPSNKVKPIASVRPLSPKHYVESPVEVVLDADHNHINAPTVVSNSLLPEKKEGAISYHDDENNMETVDAHWVIDRIAQLRLTTDGADHPSISDNENTAGSHSFAENTVSTPSMPSVAIDEHCDQCRIHKSWLIAAMMARVCKRIKINYSSASAGAIPLTHDGWKNLLTFRLSSRAVGRAPCIRCESALSRCLAIFRKSQDLLDLAPENVRPIAKKTHERCVSMDEERMRSTLFDSFAQSSTQSSGHSASLPLENGVHEDQSCAISQKSDHVDNGKEVQRPTNEEVAYHVSPEMDWILAVDARVVLVIASIVIGYRDLILILKESSVLLDALSPEHWNTISLLGVRDQAMKRDEVNAEVITETIRSLSYTTFDVSSLNTNKVLRRDRFQTQAPMYSWIIDSNGSCPVCTLNLKSDVGNKDLSVISFVCGHAYHTICLTRRSSGCLMCRGRMKSANAGRPPHISRM